MSVFCKSLVFLPFITGPAMLPLPPTSSRLAQYTGTQAQFSQTVPIRDNQYRTIGYYKMRGDRTEVYSKDWVYLGMADKTGTYDKNHLKISPDPVPALLLPRN
jgi:hypothetical protein